MFDPDTVVFLPNGQVMGRDKPASLSIRQNVQEIYDIGIGPRQYIAGRPEMTIQNIDSLEELNRKIQQERNPMPAYNGMPLVSESRPLPAFADKNAWVQKAPNENMYKAQPPYQAPQTLPLTGMPSGEVKPRGLSSVPQTPQPDRIMKDPRWGSKTAWSSDDILERQKSLLTYSAEMAMFFELLRTIATRALNRIVEVEELKFYANWGTPIVDNKQSISATIQEPISLWVMVVRQLVGGKLRWLTEVSATEDTPMTVAGRIVDLSNASGEIDIDPISATGGEREEQEPCPQQGERDRNRRRRVRL